MADEPTPENPNAAMYAAEAKRRANIRAMLEKGEHPQPAAPAPEEPGPGMSQIDNDVAMLMARGMVPPEAEVVPEAPAARSVPRR